MKLTRTDLIKIIQKTNGRCFYCNSPNATYIDHFFSRQKYKELELEDIMGNPDKLENLFLSCVRCNSKKKDKWPEDFIGIDPGKVWKRYYRANQRIGECLEVNFDLLQ